MHNKPVLNIYADNKHLLLRSLPPQAHAEAESLTNIGLRYRGTHVQTESEDGSQQAIWELYLTSVTDRRDSGRSKHTRSTPSAQAPSNWTSRRMSGQGGVCRSTKTYLHKEAHAQMSKELRGWASSMWEYIIGELQDENNTTTKGERSRSGSSQGLTFAVRTCILRGTAHSNAAD